MQTRFQGSPSLALPASGLIQVPVHLSQVSPPVHLHVLVSFLLPLHHLHVQLMSTVPVTAQYVNVPAAGAKHSTVSCAAAKRPEHLPARHTIPVWRALPKVVVDLQLAQSAGGTTETPVRVHI